jgi:hypothetical protein
MPVQKVLFVPLVSLAFVGRLLGYKASYPEYSGSEPPLGIEDEHPSEASEAMVGIVVAGIIALLALVALLRRARRSSG